MKLLPVNVFATSFKKEGQTISIVDWKRGFFFIWCVSCFGLTGSRSSGCSPSCPAAPRGSDSTAPAQERLHLRKAGGELWSLVAGRPPAGRGPCTWQVPLWCRKQTRPAPPDSGAPLFRERKNKYIFLNWYPCKEWLYIYSCKLTFTGIWSFAGLRISVTSSAVNHWGLENEQMGCGWQD